MKRLARRRKRLSFLKIDACRFFLRPLFRTLVVNVLHCNVNPYKVELPSNIVFRLNQCLVTVICHKRQSEIEILFSDTMISEITGIFLADNSRVKRFNLTVVCWK
jgi:hypothetical protein